VLKQVMVKSVNPSGVSIGEVKHGDYLSRCHVDGSGIDDGVSGRVMVRGNMKIVT